MLDGRNYGKVAVSWLKIAGLGVGLGLGLAARILSHETATLPQQHPLRSSVTLAFLKGLSPLGPNDRSVHLHITGADEK